MKSKSTIILAVLLVIALGFIGYQNFVAGGSGPAKAADGGDGEQLYTCGMHPDIISDEPGNCPICEMKLTPIKQESKKADGEREVAYWVAPMDPNEIYNEPGKSKMGMDLVPVYEDEISGSGIVKIDPVTEQNMNIKVEKVEKRKLEPVITTNGMITVDERNEYVITTKAGGWIEDLYVNYTGQRVNKNEPLLKIYSPELVAAQQEYVSALKYRETLAGFGSSSSGSSDLVKNSRNKLKLLDVSDRQISALENGDEPVTYMNIYAPASGTVIMKNVREGEKIKPGTELLHIADLSDLWIEADVYEHEMGYIEEGDPVTFRVDAFPGEEFKGKVDFVYPTIEQKTRTAKVRIDIPNIKNRFKPAMLAEVEIGTEATGEYPVVSQEAVIRSGKNNIVVLAIGDGKYKPVEVKLGKYANGYYQVLDGLSENSYVVSSAQFLIDSESSLKSAIKQFSGPKGNEEKAAADTTKSTPIDVASHDHNNDGKVFQCPMDWHILEDEAGRCPLCEMKLKEYTIGEATDNLLEHGYEVKENTHKGHEQMDMSGNDVEMKGHDHSESETEESKNGSELVRTGEIDLEKIDKNNDGKVFECPMDWNVLSDEAGRCPLCEMKLKEYTLEEAAANLKEHGHQIKEHDHSHAEQNEYGIESPLIRTGAVDVAAIDENGDGKVYQCPMDWNIIGDEYSRCPACEMKMKEYTLEEAKKNLLEHGYEIK